MNVLACIQKDIDKKKEELQKQIDELTESQNALWLLPKEILDLDDCIYTFNICGELTIHYESEKSIVALKMMGIQGFKPCFFGQYTNSPKDWYWREGQLVIGDKKFNFSGGKARKPAGCRIEEIEEQPKPPEKKLQAICTMTGEKI